MTGRELSSGTIGAVVVHYRHWPDVRRCLDALMAQTRVPDEIVIVDNCSGDGSPGRIRAAYDRVDTVEAPENRGYGAGVNLGLDRLRADHTAILVVTHECVLAPDALERLRDRLDADERIGAVGPLIALRSDPDRVFSVGGTLDRRTWRGRHVQKPTATEAWDGAAPRAVDWLDGSCMLFRSAAVSEMGQFDDSYFMYFEELDYFTGMRRAGWRVECVPAARAWQEPGAKTTYLYARNQLRFLARNAPRRRLVHEMFRLLRRLGRRLPREPDGSSRHRVELTALLDYLRGRSGPPPERFKPAGSVPVADAEHRGG